MLKVAIIVFREILEIAIVISILVAATNGIKGRNKWIFFGIGWGIFGAFLLAMFTNIVSDSLDGNGQEVFNATVLLISSAMIAWTVLWMQKYGKQISANLKQLGKLVAQGDKHFVAVMLVVAFAVLREGAEIVLFSYGAFVSGDNIAELIFGALVGLASGMVIGFALYFGLLKVLGRYFFPVTSWLLVFLAAGMVSMAIGFLSRAGFVPELIYPIWDSTFLVSEEGILGKMLNALFGYITKPSLTQLIGYLVTVLALAIGLNYDSLKSKLSTK